MRFNNIDNWEYTEKLDGLLYFVQRCEEMLFDYVIDNYKFPVMDTYLLAQEYIDTYEVVKNNNINDKHLDIILEELLYTFNNDFIIKKSLRASDISYFDKAFSSCKKDDIIKYVKYLYSLIGSFYFQNTIMLLLEYVNQPKEKKIIEKIAKILVSELIGNGYSQQYIYFRLRSIFYQSRVTSVDSIKTFLSFFNFEIREYTVYIAVSKEINFMREIFEHKLGFSFDDDGNFSRFMHDKDKIIVCYNQITALDEFNASKEVLNRLDLYLQFYGFVIHKKRIQMQDKGMIYDKKENRFGFIPISVNEFSIIRDLRKDEAKELAKDIIDSIVGSNIDLNLIFKAVYLHNNAAYGNNFENGFTNLWSIFETIIPSEQSKYRIEYIIDKLKPVYRCGYLYKVISELSDYLKQWNEEEHKSLLENIDIDWEDKEKVAAFILLPEYENLRIEYYSKLQKFPIIRSRISQFNSLFKNVGDINSVINNHLKRFEWHLYRIYRIRNLIVHCGESTKYIKVIGEHLHSYVDEFILYILLMISLNPNLSTVEDIILNIKRECEIFNAEYQPNVVITKENLIEILHRRLV